MTRHTMTVLGTLWLCGSFGCAPVTMPDVSIIAVGDSITGGIDESTYPRFVAEAMQLPDGAIAAEGQGGRTSEEALLYLADLLNTGTYPNARWLIYYVGGADLIGATPFEGSADPGDVFDSMAENIRSAVQLAHAHGIEVVLVNYAPINGSAPCPILGEMPSEGQLLQASENIDILNETIASVAESESVAFADVRLDAGVLLSDVSHYSDCIHPSGSGAAIIADRIVTILTAID